jgi:hypothetical protein
MGMFTPEGEGEMKVVDRGFEALLIRLSLPLAADYSLEATTRKSSHV